MFYSTELTTFPSSKEDVEGEGTDVKFKVERQGDQEYEEKEDEEMQMMEDIHKEELKEVS